MHATLLGAYCVFFSILKQTLALCPAGLLIDDFSNHSEKRNNLRGFTSDDGSMSSIGSVAGGALSVTPKQGGYFYESLGCQAARSEGYDALQFVIQGPVGGSVGIELQTQPSCSQATKTSYYHTVTGLTGQKQSFTVPWTSWPSANPDAIVGLVWYAFSQNDVAWHLGSVRLACTIPKPAVSTPQGAESPVITGVPTIIVPKDTGACSNFLIEDFTSQSRMTFLYYNANLRPTSDDATMQSVTVDPVQNRGTFVPKNLGSYWFTQLGCMDTIGQYEGISMRINAPAGTQFVLQMGYSNSCGDTNVKDIDVATDVLGWTFDGTERLYSFKFSQFPGLDASKLHHFLLSRLVAPVTVGPISFYCKGSVSEYILHGSPQASAPQDEIAAPSGTAAPLIIDNFSNKDTNLLGQYHGGDDGMILTWGSRLLQIQSPDPDYSFYSQFTGTCKDMTAYESSYLHIKYVGSTSFSISLQQHNRGCNEAIAPYPETWDEVEASRYAANGDIYVPMSHFNIDKTRTIGVALKAWYSQDATIVSLIEIVPSVPAGFKIESKLPTGQLIFACKRPNSFAFCIDDGDPKLAQQVLSIIKQENIKVTFFTVGAPLLDLSTNLSNVYHEMTAQGHQIALHSYTHPKMEGLPNYDTIDWEYNNDLSVVKQTFPGLTSPYFRPPFGTEGARMRYRWTQASGNKNAYIVNWSVDVEDWLWATGSTPEKQLAAFKRDVDKGGNLVVMHYLYPSTVSYLQEFIQYAKMTGKQLMRLDQCMMDPNAPPL
ncbi:glycoside hydrolase/deacetylase [Microthyrium microscopicum]|uniref:Glycoside hydrolase/deacetylase n=1 Tax=Microthyrium microscopicum TaxID=703497 RepID=A0A6A6ULH9_9PEZI|nr:glycoside hydrolase/deacetylase [Microthyrium microscopicum]